MLFSARGALTIVSLLCANSAFAASWPHVRVGGFAVNAGYSAYGPPWFDPFLLGYVNPGFYTGFPYQPAMGQVRLRTRDKTAWVYIDGGLAGRADKLKNMWLEPGTYDVEVRGGRQTFQQKIYVLSGKTLTLKQ